MANRNPAGVWHNPDWLTEQRVVRGLTTYEIADLAGCSRASVERELHRIGLLPDRERKEPPPVVAVPVVDDEPDDEPEPPMVDCLDCDRPEGSGCDGCALAYEMQGELWVDVRAVRG
ncbi:MAG: hypothetical protein ABFD92_20960 [Planctomycetaceae bacterium]